MAIYNCPQCGAILPYSGAACSSCARKRADEQRWRNQSSSQSSYVSNGSSSTSSSTSSHSSSRSYAKELDRLSEVVTKFDKLLSFTGYKKQSFSDGSYYEGDFVNGKFHGKGKYTWANGTYYEGEFANGDFNGYGKRTYDDGAVYEGEFENDMRHGKGKMILADGETYEGVYKEGKRHGRGRCVLPDGTVQDGYFENGKFVGTNAPVDRADDGEMDISPETFAQFVASRNIPPAQATPKAEPPKLVEESFEGLSDQEIWDRLLTMSADEKKAYFKAHHELTIPKGTEVIPANCFRLCFGLKKINFNEELREIGEWAFTAASIDSVLVIPKSVENIGKHAFDMCRSIEKLVLPNNITVADYAFGFTNALAEVEFETEPPQGVVLGTGVFSYCDKHAMTSKEMIKKIKALNKKAFK